MFSTLSSESCLQLLFFSSADPLLASVHFRSLLFNDFTFLLTHWVQVQVLVAAFWTRSCNVSCFCHRSSVFCLGLCRLFSVLSPPVLPLPFCHELFPPRWASLPPLYLVRSSPSTQLPLPFVNGFQCNVRDSVVSFFCRTFAVILHGHSDVHWSACVNFLLS